jgi:hypothetical protein
MQWTRFILGLGVLGLVSVTAPAAKTIVVYPVVGEAIEAADLASVTRLFRDAIESKTPGDSVSVSRTACADRECALSTVRAVNIDPSIQVIYSSFYKLGSKWIFSGTILNADGSNAFSQRLTAASIEDMEAVTVRMADALMARKTTDQVASVDNISEKEAEDEPDRRRSLYKGGIAVGYLFPFNNDYEYTNRSSLGHVSTHDYAQMIRLTWLNTWEFRNNLQLGTDLVWSTPSAFGADASLRYLFNRGDYTPFVGGGVGLHYVHSDHYDDPADAPAKDKRNSGPALNAQGGVMLFRTYDVNVMLRGQYQVIFNSDIDQGIAADVGVSFGSKGGGRHATGSSDSDGFGVWEAIGAGALLLFVIAILQ